MLRFAKGTIGALLVVAVGACEGREPTRRSPANATGARSTRPVSSEVVALVLATRRAREAGFRCTPALAFPPLSHQTIGIVLDRALTAAAQQKADAIARGAEFSHGDGNEGAE